MVISAQESEHSSHSSIPKVFNKLRECGRSNQSLSFRTIPVYVRKPIRIVCPGATVKAGTLKN
jgi:hypothetical protein